MKETITINLIDDYVISIDEFNFTLCKKRIIKSGKEEGKVSYNSIAYFPDIESAVRRFLEESTRDQLEGIKDMTISEYFDRHKEIVDKAVADIVKAVGK